ncbi:MAG: ribosome-associated heat shock protein Hsp15, partial [Roseivirga sp.]
MKYLSAQDTIFIPLLKAYLEILTFYMRIDKYLWSIRYFKTRSIATEACKKGHIKINQVSVKPSKVVFNGEEILIRKNQINYQIIIL